MINNRKVIAIIPARGGSKGVPRKNIRKLGNIPLIGWTIQHLKNIQYIDRVICSTDDEEIASVAKEFGCEVPFIRPVSLGSDTANTIEVVLHALDWIEKNEGVIYDIVVQLYCTSPFRRREHIEEAIQLYANKNVQNLMSVCETDFPPFWTCKVDSKGFLYPIFENELANTQRQRLPKTFKPNGAICITEVQALHPSASFINPPPYAYLMDSKSSIDIDTEEDFLYAEFLIKNELSGC